MNGSPSFLIGREKEILWLDLEKKRAAAYDWIGKNPKEILGWFGKYL